VLPPADVPMPLLLDCSLNTFSRRSLCGISIWEERTSHPASPLLLSLQTEQSFPSNSEWNSGAGRPSQTRHFAIDALCDRICGSAVLVPTQFVVCLRSLRSTHSLHLHFRLQTLLARSIRVHRVQMFHPSFLGRLRALGVTASSATIYQSVILIFSSSCL